MADQVQNVIVRMRAEGVDAAGQQVERFAKKSTDAMQKQSSEARKMAYQMSQVNMQVTDVVVSLASGQNPLTVFMQQGGQLSDQFGGAAPAAAAFGRAVLGLITPLKLATGSVIGLVAAYVSGVQQSAEFRDALIASGNAAGVTESQFNALAGKVSESANISIGASREIGLALVSSGTVGAKALESTAEAVANVARVTGKAGTEVAQDFARMSSGVVQWAAEHNKAWNFIDSAQMRYIAQLEKQGKVEEAMIEVNKALSKQFSAAQQNLGYLERAWYGVGKMASWAWDRMTGIGREDTLDKQIADLEAKLQERMKPGNLNAYSSGGKIDEAWQRGNDLLQKQIEQLRARDAQERAAAAARAETARREGEQVKKIAEEAKKVAPKGNPEADYQKMVRETISNRAVRLADIEAKGYEAANRAAADNMAKTAEMLARRNEQAADFAQQLADQTAQINVGMIADDRARGEAQIELDRQVMQARIDALAQGGADVAALQEQLNANILARQQQLTEQLKPEWQRMLDEWGNTTRLMQKTYDETMSNLLKSSEDMFVKLMTGQKVNVKDFANQILADMARAQFRQYVGENVKAGGGIAGLLGLPTVKGYSGDEKSSNFMGPLTESADELRAANSKTADGMQSLAKEVAGVVGSLDGFGSVVAGVARALLTLGSNAGSGSLGSLGGLFDSFGSWFKGWGGTESLTIPTDVPGMSLAVGTNRIPADGWKYLHEGEAVLPKPFNPWAGGGGGGMGQNVTINSTVVMNGGGADSRADLQRMLDQRDAVLKAQMIDQLRRTGTAAHRAARA